MLRSIFHFAAALACLACLPASAQEARLRPAEEVLMPTATDGNCPSFWLNDRLQLFTSIGWPLRLSEADSQFGPWQSHKVRLRGLDNMAVWVESAWVDADGTIFGWYHTEPWGMYEDSLLTAPRIGALVSFDGGRSVEDLGIILESGDALDDNAQNGAFTGGHGDFSVVLDRDRKHFYFFFSNYGGSASSQGVAVARMAFADRFEPKGKVYKFYGDAWTEPGVGGRLTPIFSAVRAWNYKDPDAFWGPSVHWNTYLGCFVMLLNHTQGEPGWTQEGVYVSFAGDLSHPDTWGKPRKVMDNNELPEWGAYYPQVMGLEEGGTDSLAGRVARFYIAGGSRWEIEFIPARPTPPTGTPPSSGASGKKPSH